MPHEPDARADVRRDSSTQRRAAGDPRRSVGARRHGGLRRGGRRALGDVSRLAAFALFALAAFDTPPPFLDRVGTAALGLAFLAWCTGRGFGLPRFSAMPSVPPVNVRLPEPDDDDRSVLRERIGAY